MKIAKFAFAPIATLSVAIFAAFAALAGNVVYVSPNGSNTPPYDTWDKATTNLQTAADLYEEATVVVRGELPMLNTRLVLDKKTFVYGEGGAVAPLKRGVSIANAGVVVSNLTLRGYWWGYNSSGAHGVQLNAAGLLTHCTVTNFFTCFGNDAQGITASDGGGVGIRAAGAVVRNCTIAGNTCWGNGCGVYIAANALVEKCLITGNRDNGNCSTPAGVGAYIGGGGTLRNCLVVKNGSATKNVANTGVVVANGLMESCTVADNFAGTAADGKALKVSWNGRVRNCIVYNNTNKNGTDTHLLDIPSDGVTYTSVSPAISGKGNTTDAPVFVPGTYKLADCSLVDKGSKQAWMDGATDFYGTMRVLGEAVDMGASEYKPAAYVTVTGSPAAYGTADPDYGKVDAWDGEKTFTCPESYTDGETVNAVCTGWKLRKGDGTELSGEGNAVNLTYSDDLEYATLTWRWAVTRLTDRYVKPDGDDTADGKTWATAWATPQKAIDAYPEATAADEITVYLGEGTFTDAQTILNVTNAVRIIGAGKGKTYLVPDNTSEAPTVLLAHPAGVVSGVSVVGNTKAAAVRFTGNAGRLEDSCVGTNSYLGVQFSDPSTGVVSRCEISGNVGSYGGLQMHCNTANRCYVENTLFKDNRASNDRGGACFTYYGGKGVFNFCTFVGNSGPRGAYSGNYTSNVVFNNCIFSGNTCTSTLLEMNFSLVSSSITVDHCWTFDGYGKDPVAGAPNFTDPVGGDFTLRYGSCCRDAAKTLGGEATALDLVGNPRLSGAAPDAGCYEFQEEGLQCDVMTSTGESASGSEVTFAAVCSQEGDYTYAWTLRDASGAVVASGRDAEWTAEIVANGYLSAELTVKDSSGEASVSSTKVANIVLVRPGETFVKPAGTEGVTPEYPYDTWEKATTSIEDAIEAVTTGGTVTLADGVHTLTEQLKVEKAVTLRGLNGRDKTVIEQTVKGPRVLKLNNAQAVVTGVTLRRGRIDTYYARKDGDSGAGVWITGAGGTVSDCRITDCAPSNYGSGVVTIGSSGGHVTRCIIDDNSYSRYWSNPYGSGSAGVVISSGRIDSCLVRGNSGVKNSGIEVSGSAKVLNCTVVDNVTASESGGGLRLGELTSGKGLVQNCIVVGNKGNEDKKSSTGYPEWTTTVTDPAKLAVISDSVVTCSFGKDFAWPLGGTHVNEDPAFNDTATGDYSLNGLSLLINAGTDYDGVEGDKDLALMPRKSGASVDVGAYEYDLSKRSVSFTVEPRLAFVGNDVTLTGSVQGGDGDVDYIYGWSVSPTGKTEVAATGSGNPLVINTLQPGMYDIRLTVTETDGGLVVGESAAPAVLQVAPKTNYVAIAEGYEGTGGEWPYDTPEKATTNIQTAIDAAVPGSCVCLMDGTHKLTEQLVITNAITLCGQHGRDKSILEQATFGPRVLKINNVDAAVEGLTIRKGRINTYYAKQDGNNGAGVLITGNGGTLRDCRVTDCAPSNYGSGIVTVDSAHGRVTRCVIDDNSYWRYWGNGYGSGSAGVVISAGQIDSCLVSGNSGVKCSGITASNRAKVLNCTVVGNAASSESAGGLSIGELVSGFGCVWNTIVCGNAGNATKSSATGYPEWMTSVSDAAKLSIVSNSVVTCSFGKDFAWPLGTAYVNEEPLFNDETAGDYTLNGNSKLVNAGTDYEGIEADADLSGLPRKSGASVDLGCHEFDLSKRTVDFVVSPAAALAGDAMSFSALVLGGEESVGYAFAWTLQNLDVPGDPIVRNGQILSLDILPPGRYSATVTVTETDGETVVGTKTVPLAAQVGAKTNYVVAAEGYVGDGGRWPYDTWERATTNVMVALETSFPNAVVCLGDGEHVITNTLKVEKSVTVMGLNGWEKTTLRHDTKAGKARVVLINDQKARVEGLTLTGGNAENEGNGLAVRIAAKGGTLSHCRVTGNEFPLMGMQGAVSVLYDASVGGIGVVENCVIDNNTHGSYQYYGTAGGVYLQSGILRNCLIFKNKGTQFGGVGIYGPAIVQNCTIVSNIVEGCKGVSSMAGGGGVNFCQKNQSVRLENCIIAFNRCGSDASDFNIATTVDTRLYPEDAAKDLVAITNNAMQVVRNCLIGDGTEIGRNQVMGLPVFRKIGATAVDGNWRLRSRSPGYKAGLFDASWMADGVDIYGEPRTKHTSQLDGPLVDIGAAEADWRGTGLTIIVR